MPDWHALSKARELDIPSDSLDRISPALDELHAAFAPLLSKILLTTEPAITLSESAVLGGPEQ